LLNAIIPRNCRAKFWDMKLKVNFYQGGDVVKIAKSLLGKFLVTDLPGGISSGMIVETEAYSWMERGCHAFNHKKTNRNAAMFEGGGVSYVYLCYGVHELFNVVTNKEGIAEAVLIRALEPFDGVDLMMRRYQIQNPKGITSGPGKLTKALGIDRAHNLADLTGDIVWIEDRKVLVKPTQIHTSARIGMNFKGKDAVLPWRFTIKGNTWVSK
jgi:DNA-3-methyladenine glycosylase